MAKNKELYEYILNLRGEDLVARQDNLQDYLGDDSDFFNLIGTPENVEEARTRAGDLYKQLSDTDDAVEITADGPPTHQQIIDLCKWKYTLAYRQSFIASLNLGNLETDEKIGAAKTLIQWSNIDFANDNSLNIFLRDSDISATYLNKGSLKQDFDYFLQRVRKKIEDSKKVPANKIKIEVHELLEASFSKRMALNAAKEKLKELRESITDTVGELDEKKNYLRLEIGRLESRLLSKSITQSEKKSVSDELVKFRAQLTAIEITSDKLRRIQTRVDGSLIEAHRKIYIDNFNLLQKVSNSKEVEFSLFTSKMDYDISTGSDSVTHDDGIKCCINNDIFYYAYENSEGKLTTAQIDLNGLGLAGITSLDEAGAKDKILAELVQRKHAFEIYPALVQDHPDATKQLAEDFNRQRNMQMLIDELNGDIAHCESIQRFSQTVADNPKKQLNANLPVNAFVDVMSLADMQSFDEKGEPYFRDEIISLRTDKARDNDSRTRFGLVGEVVTRGVYINQGEVKRSTYPGSAGQEPRIVLETSHVQQKKSGENLVQVSSRRSAKNLSPEEKNLLAFKMAKEMLLQYREGDKKFKIVLESKNPNHADQASRVYAALLILTSTEDDTSQNKIDLAPSKIEIKVPGANKPSFFTRSMDSKKQFYESYFTDKAERQEMRSDTTTLYRKKRQDIGTKSAERAHVKPDASEDTHSIDVEDRLRLRGK